MNRHIARSGTAAGICLGMIFGVAQSGANATGQRGREDTGGQVTVTGCLIEFSKLMSPSGATSENSRTSGGEQFVLANVRSASSSSPSAEMPGSAGVSGTAGSGATPQSATGGASVPASSASTSPNSAAESATRRYLVIGPQIDELRKHVMHQVEVSGTLEPRRPSAAESASPASAPPPATGDAASREGASRGAPDRSGTLSNLPRLHTSSIRMIAGACTSPGSSE
jgi:hypothetical protein